MNFSIVLFLLQWAAVLDITRGDNIFQMFLNTITSLRKQPIQNLVKFYCYQSQQSDAVEVFMDDPLLEQKLDTSLPLAFLIHGFTGSYKDTAYQLITQDYIKYVSSNLCIVDWNYLASMEYMISAKNTVRVGDYTGDFITYLTNKKYFIMQDIKVIGFSLGAHVAGYVGARLNGRLPLIIGLDPAGPGFTQIIVKKAEARLNPSVAQFVQVLHTNRNEFGADAMLGDADYYANGGGSPQPGCKDAKEDLMDRVSCSHSRAQKLFRSSLNPANVFLGHQCNSYECFKLGECANAPTDVFGIYSNNTVRGTLYFETTDTFPFV